MRQQTDRKQFAARRLLAAAGLCLSILISAGQQTNVAAQTVPEKRFKPQLVVQTGHSEQVEDIAFSFDDKFAASGGRDSAVKVWDTASGLELLTINGHSNALAFSPNSYVLAHGSDKNVELWSAATGDKIHTLTGHKSSVTSVAFSPDGKILVSGSDDGIINLWDTSTGKIIDTFSGGVANIGSIAFSPDGETFAVGGLIAVELWNIKTKEPFGIIDLYQNSLITRYLTFSPDGKTLAVSGASTNDETPVTINFWDVAGQKLLRRIETKTSPQRMPHIAYSPDGAKIAFAGAGKTAIYDAGSGAEIWHLAEEPTAVAYSPKGDFFAAGFWGRMILWNAKSKIENPRTFGGHSPTVTSVAVSRDMQTLAMATRGNKAKIWDLKKGELSYTIEDAEKISNTVAFSPTDSQTLAVGGWSGVGKDGSTILWNTASKTPTRLLGKSVTFTVAFTSDGNTLGYAGSDLKLYDLKTAAQSKTVAPGESPTFAFSPDGTKMISAVYNEGIYFWDISGEKPRLLWEQPRTFEDCTFSVAYHPREDLVAIGCSRGAVKILDAANGGTFRNLAGSTGSIYTLAFSPDGKMLAAGAGALSSNFSSAMVGQDNTISLWEVGSGARIRILKGHEAGLRSVEFTPDGKFLISGSADGTVKIWRADAGKLVASLIAIDKDDWAVVTPEGLFDASEGAQQLMYWRVGREIVALDQLKNRYYVPGLLSKIFKSETLPQVGEFAVALYPRVEIEQARQNSNQINLKLENRGGGIGRVEVRVNGSELSSDARVGKAIDTKAANVNLSIEIPAEKLRAGANRIEVVAWNLEGDVRSKNIETIVESEGAKKGVGVIKIPSAKKPSEINFYAVVSGISDYEGNQLDLRYAAKDAEDISKALTLAARKYFCNDELANKKPCERVHIKLLSTEKEKESQFAGLADVPDFQRVEPTKNNYKNVFAEISQKAKPEDVVVVYLSGHGTSITSDEAVKESAFPDMYLYATRDAATLERAAMVNETERAAKTVSSLELAKWVSEIKADKKVMILDTCAAGAAQKDLISQSRAVDALQVRSIDRLRERTGFYILMGSAADAVSYEANEFRQGLLTYSLIEAMTTGSVLRDGKFLDVENWFAFAEDKVETLAKGIGGIQRPSFFKSNYAKTFDIGRIEREEQKLIPLAQRVPLILQPELREKDKFTDKERLTEKLEIKLLEQSASSARGEVAAVNYIKATTAANGLSPRGFYTVNADGTITIDVSLVRDEEELSKVKVTAGKDEIIEKLLHEIVKAVQNKK